MLTHTEARDLLTTARNPHRGKPLANNTRLYPDGDGFAVRLHATDVVRILPRGQFELSTGGWHTMTTCDRIGAFSPAIVGLWRGCSYVVADPRVNWQDRETVALFDGIRVHPGGRVFAADLPRARRRWADHVESVRSADREAARQKRAFDREARALANGDGSVLGDVPDDVRRWAALYGAPLDDATGMLTVVKAVGDDYTAGYATPDGEDYRPGGMVTAPDYAPTELCGAGLHFCATGELSRGYFSGATRYVTCEVPASAVIVLGDKVKAPIAFPVAEVAAA